MLIQFFERLFNRREKSINEPFMETFPRVGSSVVPGDIPYEEWVKSHWAKEERKPIIEILKETK